MLLQDMALLEPSSFEPEVDDTGDVSSSDEGDSSSSEHGSLAEAGDLAERLRNLDWCTCTCSLCDSMPTARECLCC